MMNIKIVKVKGEENTDNFIFYEDGNFSKPLFILDYSEIKQLEDIIYKVT